MQYVQVPLPLALCNVRDRLLAGYYRQPEALAHDAATIAANAAVFNGPDSAVAKRAQGALLVFIPMHAGPRDADRPHAPARSGTAQPSSCAEAALHAHKLAGEQAAGCCPITLASQLLLANLSLRLLRMQSWRTLWRRWRMAAGRPRRSGIAVMAKKRRAPLWQAGAGGAPAQVQGQVSGRLEAARCGGRALGGRGTGPAAEVQGQGLGRRVQGLKMARRRAWAYRSRRCAGSARSGRGGTRPRTRAGASRTAAAQVPGLPACCLLTEHHCVLNAELMAVLQTWTDSA